MAVVPIPAHLRPSMTLVSQSRALPAYACVRAVHASPQNRSKVCFCPKAAAARTYRDPASRDTCALRGMDLRATNGVHFCRKTLSWAHIDTCAHSSNCL